MSPRKKCLSSEAVAASRKATIRRYADKNKVKLQASARARMQRLRSVPPTEEQLKAKQIAQKKYHVKHNSDIRQADSLRRARIAIEKHGAENFDDRANQASMSRTQRKHERRAPLPRPQRPEVPNYARSERIVEPWSDPESSDEEELGLGPIPVYGRATSHPPSKPQESPTPDLTCDCCLPAFCPKCTCGCDYTCCLYHHENEDANRRWMKELTREENTLSYERARARGQDVE
ncbi:hypothetical protein B0H15DRAFT_958293 [Mycena belliarum]|uniref:Uncharacterized protein n=1 Tax=Mycena belliarum TaxID=1033014 RepID=A0AAD6XHN9_9AGAR|nr:hypothetical protein B0H15DRAFT_958293 [Mycena belliae]